MHVCTSQAFLCYAAPNQHFQLETLLFVAVLLLSKMHWLKQHVSYHVLYATVANVTFSDIMLELCVLNGVLYLKILNLLHVPRSCLAKLQFTFTPLEAKLGFEISFM